MLYIFDKFDKRACGNYISLKKFDKYLDFNPFYNYNESCIRI